MAFSKESFHAWLDSDGSVEFDIYAQDPNAWHELSDAIPGLIVASAGGMFPFQAEGLLQGYPFYFRAEWGYAELKVGARDGEKPYLPQNALYIARVRDVADLTEPEVQFERLMLMLVPKLEKGPYLWRFPCKKIEFTKTGDHAYRVLDEQDTVTGWGYTPAEGYAASQEPFTHMHQYGWTDEFQHQLWLDREVQPEPVNHDEREYPVVKPDFRVTL